MKILVIGASGHAKVIIDIIEQAGAHEIVGLITEDPGTDRMFGGYPVLGGLHDLLQVAQEHHAKGLIAAVGDNWGRGEVARRVRDNHAAVDFITLVHPSAQIARCVEIGSGTVIMAGAVVNSGSRVGCHCVINTRASIDHDSVIGEFVSIAPGATLGGNVHIGDFSAISLGSSIIHGLTIGEHTVIGAGSVVLRDVPSYVVAYGTPARVIRERQKGQRYL
jgi:sugar O-acyltransferase (sialic acid O-acetyltransferase NeuD family)